jgi:GT2 family glycosyltransferase
MNHRPLTKSPKIGVSIVAYSNVSGTVSLVGSLAAQMEPGDSIVIIDNHEDHLLSRESPLNVKVIQTPNDGFAVGQNLAVENLLQNGAEIIVVINPDVSVGEDFLMSVRRRAFRYFDAWMPLILTPKQTINSAGNIVHITGLSWTKQFLQPISNAPTKRRSLSVLSGACLVISAAAWRSVGGFATDYFLYYEDTDLSTRLYRYGWRMGIDPAVKVVHDIDFIKGDYKWFYIERNRLVYIINTWPLGAILALLPILIAVEPCLFIIAALQGRLKTKASAWLAQWSGIGRALKQRKTVTRLPIGSYEFYKTLEYKLSNPYFGILNSMLVGELLHAAYWFFSIPIVAWHMLGSLTGRRS